MRPRGMGCGVSRERFLSKAFHGMRGVDYEAVLRRELDAQALLAPCLVA
jgi:hypothetical protein